MTERVRQEYLSIVKKDLKVIKGHITGVNRPSFKKKMEKSALDTSA